MATLIPNKKAQADPAPAGVPLYPVFLKLAGRLVLVVGGGAVARQKAGALRAAGARVTVVAPEWRADFSVFAVDDSFILAAREFSESDLDGVFLVIAATDDPQTQATVAAAAEARGLLLNVADVPARCNFYLPAVLRRGDLAVAVSTAGRSPRFAVKLRDWIDRRLPLDLARALALLERARAESRARHPGDAGARLREFDGLLDDATLEAVLGGRLEPLERRVSS